MGYFQDSSILHGLFFKKSVISSIAEMKCGGFFAGRRLGYLGQHRPGGQGYGGKAWTA
jgi:hypothetical protein